MNDLPDLTDANETSLTPTRITTDVRSVSLAVLATVAVIYVVHWAKFVVIPITLAIFLRYALMPFVTWLKKRARIPAALGALLVLSLLVAAIGVGIAALHDPALDMLDKLPRAAQKFELAMRQSVFDGKGAMGKLKKAATEIDKAATTATAPAIGAAGQTPAKPVAATPLPPMSTYLWSGSLGLAVGLGQAVIVLALAYFLLIAGDTFKRKLVRISGDTLTEKKITVQILHEIDHQIQRYLLVQLAAAVLQGVLIWAALAMIGLENAAFWGVVAGVLHLIPYIGPTVVIVLTAIVAYLQFPEVMRVAVVIGSTIGITTLVGFGMMPWITEKLSRLNAVTVFVALLFWGWIWGIWGLLLGVPIVMAIQAICERIVDLQPIAELLGFEPPKVAAPVELQQPTALA